MAKQSLGLIETVGLTVVVEAADAAVKSANVNLVGYELTEGGGMVTVKLEGEVGAVNAAIVAAGKVGQVYAHKVIARTAEGIEAITHSAETVGVAKPEPRAPEAAITHPQRLNQKRKRPLFRW
ncbi:MAG: BMC domain-containing protein [Symbiopectobacterium sp.]|uniref:BMC domain-containing protein n=1 Tax=Symbiopectobacterium sp. TaxID=2952789 RepID=UPI0039EA1754